MRGIILGSVMTFSIMSIIIVLVILSIFQSSYAIFYCIHSLAVLANVIIMATFGYNYLDPNYSKQKTTYIDDPELVRELPSFLDENDKEGKKKESKKERRKRMEQNKQATLDSSDEMSWKTIGTAYEMSETEEGFQL